MKLIIGLGNPGKEYENTRHNAGAMFLEQFCGDNFENKPKLSAKIYKRGNVIFAIPTTFMNCSGMAAGLIGQFFGGVEEVLVVFDDVSLPVGVVRLNTGVSGSTHNGVKDVLGVFPKADRLKIGVLPEHPVSDLSNFVLDKFTKKEIEEIDWGKAEDLLREWVEN